MIPFQLHRHIPLVRRPFWQRDQAIKQRNHAIQHKNSLAQELDFVRTQRDLLIEERDRLSCMFDKLEKDLDQATFDANIATIRHRPIEIVAGEGAITGSTRSPNDQAIVGRIINAYRPSSETPMGSSASFWLTDLAELRRPEHDTLMTGDPESVQAMLRNPTKNNLLYGFDNLAEKIARMDEAWIKFQGQYCYDILLALAEAVGIVSLAYPEAPPRLDSPGVETLLGGLDAAFGFRIEFPNPYPGEVGLSTSRGVASFRAVQALYQAWTIAKIAPRGRVLEIGGGLGRTAYYASKFAIADYSIVDLPLTGAAQAYFLSCVGLDVQLYKEPAATGVKLMPPVAFHQSSDPFDLIVNVDSFTEMAEETARDYLETAARRSPLLLSINHEYNAHRMFDAFRGHPAVAHMTRDLYWLRRGYVSELVTFK